MRLMSRHDCRRKLFGQVKPSGQARLFCDIQVNMSGGYESHADRSGHRFFFKAVLATFSSWVHRRSVVAAQPGILSRLNRFITAPPLSLSCGDFGLGAHGTKTGLTRRMSTT